MLSEAILKQAVEELAIALIESLQAPEQYQHQFSNEFDCNMVSARFLMGKRMNT